MCNLKYIQNLCGNIRILREREGLTLPELASRLELSEEDVARLENGDLPEGLKVEALVRLEKAFDVSLKDLFLPYEM